MKKILLAAIMIAGLRPISLKAQNDQANASLKKNKPGIGLKVGYNYSSLSGTSDAFNPGNKSGFMVAGFYATPSAGLFGFRSEIVFSRQGFTYNADGSKENLTHDYIYLPQLTTLTFAKIVQVQAGMQIGFLISAKDSKKETGTAAPDIMSYYNRIDYGFAGGFEIYPIKGLILGGRYNISFGNLYKQEMDMSTQPYPVPFDPGQLKGKNQVMQVFIGYKF
ncbi:MAG: hypothetical protein C5B52_13735 [Bacteroidetes bacterium]|nr:MAG: hypothetical protein C5B52_13735 [Bacteroidota bacterium]